MKTNVDDLHHINILQLSFLVRQPAKIRQLSLMVSKTFHLQCKMILAAAEKNHHVQNHWELHLCCPMSTLIDFFLRKKAEGNGVGTWVDVAHVKYNTKDCITCSGTDNTTRLNLKEALINVIKCLLISL